MRSLLMLVLLMLAGCDDVVVVQPGDTIEGWGPVAYLPDEPPAVPSPVVQPQPVITPFVNVPPAKPEPAKPTAAIMRDARGQYIVRRGQRCYWSESRKAWREPIKGGCAGGICGYRDIKPGQ